MVRPIITPFSKSKAGFTAKIGILCNPNSRKGKKWLQQQLAHCAPSAFLLQETQNVEDIKDALHVFAKEGITHLCLIGGDGTLDAAITAIRQHKPFSTEPTLAVFAAGTTNMSFRDVGFKVKKPKKALHSFIEASQKDKLKTLQRAALQVTSNTLNAPILGFFMGMGAIPRVIHQTRQNLHTRGFTSSLSEALSLLKTFYQLFRATNIEEHPTLTPTLTHFEFQEKQIQQEVVCLALTSLEKLLLGITPQKNGEGGIALLGINASYRKLRHNLWPLLRGHKIFKLEEQHGYISDRVPSLTLAFDGEWTLDGEMFQTKSTTPLNISTTLPFSFAVGVK